MICGIDCSGGSSRYCMSWTKSMFGLNLALHWHLRVWNKKKNIDPLFEVCVNKMLVQSTHNVMPLEHDITGAGLLKNLEYKR